MENRNELVWNFVLFDHLDLFRISDFEFRAFSLLLIPWRPLRLCASHSALIAALPRWVSVVNTSSQ
jgi:hypothetical protein